MILPNPPEDDGSVDMTCSGDVHQPRPSALQNTRYTIRIDPACGENAPLVADVKVWALDHYAQGQLVAALERGFRAERN